MPFSVRFLPEAEEEVIGTARWYDIQRTGLGDEFLAALADVVDAIRNRPQSFPLTALNCRRAILRRFPYCIYFKVNEDRATVIAVLHGHRNPTTWQSRIF